MELGMIGLGRMGTNMVRRLLRAGSGGDQVGRDLVPAARLAEHVEAGEPPGRGAGHCSLPIHCSLRRIAASSPMPPTIVTSSGASKGGPISRL